MKTIKKLFTAIIMVTTLITISLAQTKPKIAVLNIDVTDVLLNPISAGDLVRIELQKADLYTVMDKYDINDIISKKEREDCYGRRCLVELGKTLNVNKMLTGSIERFEEKIIINLRLINVRTGIIEKTDVGEYWNLQEEIQSMIGISVNNLLDIENDAAIVNNLVYSLSGPTTILNLSGPRMGAAYITEGEMNKRLQAPEEYGGYDGYPVMSQFGYQYEIQYLSAGNFQALVEFVFMISGLEQQMFIPSLTFMNGFRLNKKGWEVAFGPSISIGRIAKGYYEEDANGVIIKDSDGNDIWHREREWAEDPSHTDSSGMIIQNPWRIFKNSDKRGNPVFTSGWVWALGKSFRSGNLNIPVNIYVAPDKAGWYVGLSVGFNVRKRETVK